MKLNKIIVDTMGYENDLSHCIKAVLDFQKNKNDLKIILVGNKSKIIPFLNKENDFEIIDTDVEILQDDTVFSARRKINSSMLLGLKRLNEDDEIQGMLTAGNTAVFVFNAFSTIGLIEGIKKPAFMPFVPTIDGVGMNILDVGASTEVDGEDLFNFAIMANALAQNRIANPKIGILNIGTESHKGFEYHKQADELLKNSNLNYIGFVEPKKIIEREVDILVSDGFSGNIALKTMEGTAKTISNYLKNEYKRKRNFLAALLSLNIFKKIKKTFDYKNNAGAFVLGMKKILVKTHGSADYQQFISSLRMLYDTIKQDPISLIKEELKKKNDR